MPFKKRLLKQPLKENDQRPSRAHGKQRPSIPVFPTCFTLIGVTILISLGMWQLNRLEWKEHLLAEMDHVVHRPYTPYDSHTLKKLAAQNPLPHNHIVSKRRDHNLNESNKAVDIVTSHKADQAAQIEAKPLFQRYFIDRITIEGQLLADPAIFLGPRTHNGMAGVHIISALLLDDGSVLFLNRGWVANQFQLESDKTIKVSGTLRNFEKNNIFVPINNVDSDYWYQVNHQDFQKMVPDKIVHPYILYIEQEDPFAADIIYHNRHMELNNNHRNYALFWFTMALILSSFFILSLIRYINDCKE
jgi:cytochrome oxidase assembly protein ShyY1